MKITSRYVPVMKKQRVKSSVMHPHFNNVCGEFGHSTGQTSMSTGRQLGNKMIRIHYRYISTELIFLSMTIVVVPFVLAYYTSHASWEQPY